MGVRVQTPHPSLECESTCGLLVTGHRTVYLMAIHCVHDTGSHAPSAFLATCLTGASSPHIHTRVSGPCSHQPHSSVHHRKHQMYTVQSARGPCKFQSVHDFRHSYMYTYLPVRGLIFMAPSPRTSLLANAYCTQPRCQYCQLSCSGAGPRTSAT